jgi:hypothetical protein
MYNLFISGSEDFWDEGNFTLDMSRCLRKYTDPELTTRYGDLDKESIATLKTIPCIFGYEKGINLDPKLGFILDIAKRQGRVRIKFKTHDIIPFLSYNDLQKYSFELDIDNQFELHRTHWALKDIDLVKELLGIGITIPNPIVAEINPIDISSYIFDVALSFPGEVRDTVREVASCLEETIGTNAYFYDDNYKSQLARPSLDLLLQGIYRRARLVVIFICSDYQRKKWCGIEFRAIQEILIDRELHRIMYIRMDDGKVEGVLQTDGYIDARNHSSDELSKFISERVTLLNQREVLS